ncbi:membrane protein [Herbaspirillum rubrisubalbicans]|uniref:Membrane protein n=1 Tax=Herbaspirillum rubrisubalbicans TaxID=80842 RepID=A0ABX9BYB4_9BURK|nr:hypothetical protein [Herbaspirillum rubrisubalbicans]MCP1575449.1 hypothetical protein [Herbaspirillum rubrisubalbicans]RAM62896.1 membrane protein [Herbaspirillum rubrisubalbicans]RAN46664.1 membrane protein [Herbaspirillum rubrisubalbicans]
MRRLRPAMLCLSLACLCLAACSPRYNWRQASDNGAHFMVLLPAKPASVTRPVDLDGPRVEMSMTAAEVDGLTFAVGSAELPDAAAATRALDAMRTALLNNIAGQPQGTPTWPGQTTVFTRTIDLDARGLSRGRPLRLVARLAVRERRVYQILIVGDEKAFKEENIETFFSSFKPS